jgi:hypothetical protein
MRAKNHFVIISCFITCLLFGQAEADCFTNSGKLRNLDLKRLQFGKKFILDLDSMNKRMSPADWDSLEAVDKRTVERVIGCKYPDTTFTTVSGKQIHIDHTNTKYVILDFNDLYCDPCLNQLVDLERIKNELKEEVIIISLFMQDKGELQFITNKYKDVIEFIPDARKYLEGHNLGQGHPVEFVLDKNKLILDVSKGGSRENGKLYERLIKFMN